MQLGGPARFFLSARSPEDVAEALRWASLRSLKVAILGGGSNLIVADAGFDGLVLQLALRGLAFGGDGELVAQAGEPWDELVNACVARDWAGLECLSGIPGLAGATPIQNVGAYGQEVAETIEAVQVLRRDDLQVEEFDPARCAFGYRDSAFKRAPDRHVVLSVRYRLRPGGAPSLRYAELQRALAATPSPSLRDVRSGVLSLRRSKSMVLDPSDDNRRSAGSFFVNPVVDASVADAVVERALQDGIVADESAVPRFEAAAGRVKLAAAWLIERSGLHKGLREGHFGLSTRHSLAIVHHGGGSSDELVAFARKVQQRVLERFGVLLRPEPVFLGFADDFTLQPTP